MPDGLEELGPVVNTALEARAVALRVEAAEVDVVDLDADSVHVDLEAVVD